MMKKAAQMLRQARRVEGIVEEEPPDEVFGFGADFEGDAVPPARMLVEQREPKLADPSVDAWCSFCCRPKSEVGAMVGGPTGSFICRNCSALSLSLSGEGQGAGRREVQLQSLAYELPSQRRARERFMQLRPTLALLIGPSGSGKTAFAQSIADAGLKIVRSAGEVSGPSLVVLTAPVPPPAFTLEGPHGAEPIHDTATLNAAFPQLSVAFLRRVDAVHTFDALSEGELVGLGEALSRQRDVELPAQALQRLAEISIKSGRGAHEIVSLLRRIPAGAYRG